MTFQIYDNDEDDLGEDDHDEDDLGEDDHYGNDGDHDKDDHDEDNHDGNNGDHETVRRLPVHQEMHELEASFDGGEIVTV